MDDEARRSEILQLEQDLANLHRRYATLKQSVRILQVGFRALALVAIAFMGWAVILANIGLAVAMILFLLALVALIGPRILFADPEPGWIDVVSWKPIGMFGPDVKRSEAMAVEDMIAERTRRLE
ncbi:MAG TPA: hypothetical protein VGX46_18070, partial [Vicinamibacterales bacterium]|nr:hypothetical protein [Vicinamibacterales bacterium]